MQVLLATYGSRGDVEPMVALAVALEEHGARVRVCAPPDDEFGSLFQRAGVELVPFGRSWRSWATPETTAEERVPSVDDFINEHIDATFGPLAAAAQGSEMLIATGMLHFVAGSVAEQAGIEHRFVVFAPGVIEPMPWQSLAVPALSAHRASLGLPPVDDVGAYLFTKQPWLAADPVLSPPVADGDSVFGLQAGAWILKDQRPLPVELEAFLTAGEAPIYVGFGSMRVAQESGEATIAAIRANRRRAVVGRGWADLGLVDDGDDCISVGEVNQQALFSRVAAVIHHGGAGTTITAARAGAPQLVVPQAVDQPYWGQRVADLRLGALHNGSTPTIESLSVALSTVLAPQTAQQASAVAATISTQGADRAARAIIDGLR